MEDRNNQADHENEEESHEELLRLTDPPIYFEPISGLTNVFFDRDNRQIFCVRSNGVGGVIVKGPKSDFNMSFRMEDKGNVATIKFSPNMSILAIRRKDKCVIDFLNFKNSQPVIPEYSQSFKAKSTKFQECYWLDNNEILLVSEQGFEHYQIFADKRALKLVKFFNMPLNWLIWSRDIQVFIVSTGSFGSILNPFVYSKGAFLKLPKFEVDLPLPMSLSKYRYSVDQTNNNAASNKYYLNESDVVVGRIYNEYYVMIIRQISSGESSSSKQSKNTGENNSSANAANFRAQGFSEIALFKLLTDSPAKKTNILKVNLSGRFTLNIIDELIIVHHRNSFSSLVFDIKMPGDFDGYVTTNYPIIKKASIESAEIPFAHTSLISESLLNQPSISGASSPSTSSHTSTATLNEMYSMNWIMFLPNVIIDAKLGCFWFIELNLRGGSLGPFSEINSEHLKLVEFLLNRKNTKLHVLNVCDRLIRKRSGLRVVEEVFNKINEFYKYSLINNVASPASNSVNIGNLSIEDRQSNDQCLLADTKAELPVIEQYDMHNCILYPLIEDDKWWEANSQYTISVIIEYFSSLNTKFIPIEHYMYKLLVEALIKSNRLYQLHQYLQYHVLADSKPLACLLLSLQSTYPASNQLALDMLKRLGTANEEICDVLLSKGLVLSALRFSIQMGFSDELVPGKFLETAKDLNDMMIFFEVFKFFEDRNVRLRGSPTFKTEENCQIFVQHFANLFQPNNKTVNSSSPS